VGEAKSRSNTIVIACLPDRGSEDMVSLGSTTQKIALADPPSKEVEHGEAEGKDR
jgi:hypothetical protein